MSKKIRTAIDPNSFTARPRARWFTHTAILTRRSATRFLSDRTGLVLLLAHPFVMLALLSQVFDPLTSDPRFPEGTPYSLFLLPTIIVMIAVSSAVLSGTALVRELANGYTQRLWTMPISLSSLLVARSVTDTLRFVVQVLGLMLGGFLFLRMPPTWGILAACAIGFALALLLGWLFILLGILVGNAEKVQMLGSFVMLPLIFGSPALVPYEALPGWLQALSLLNPLAHALELVRGAVLGEVGGLVGPVFCLAAVVSSALLCVASSVLLEHKGETPG